MVAVVVVVLVLVAVSHRMFSAGHGSELEIQTARSLARFCQTSKTCQFQIVSAIFDAANTPFTPQQLSRVYRSVEVEEEEEEEEEERRTLEKKLRKQGKFTIQYVCALGDASADNPCRPFTGGGRRTVLVQPGGQGSCYRQCSLTPADHRGPGRAGPFTITITSNILNDHEEEEEDQSVNVVEYQVYTAEGEGGGWRCLELGYRETIYREVREVKLRLLLQRQSLISRLWLSVSGAASFSVSCYTLNNTRPRCQQKASSTGRTTTPTAEQAQASQTTRAETLTNIISVVVPTGGIIVLAIIIAITALRIKHRQTNSATTTTKLITSPGQGRTPTPRHTVSGPSPRRQEDRSHGYCSLAMPETPRSQRDMENARRKRTAYCHCKDDYEDWVLPVKESLKK